MTARSGRIFQNLRRWGDRADVPKGISKIDAMAANQEQTSPDTPTRESAGKKEESARI